MKRLGLLLCIILFSQCTKEKITQSLDSSGNIYKTEGLSIRLYPEYKKINEKEEGVLFASKDGEIAIILFKENVSEIKKFYSLTPATQTFTLKNCKAYLFTEKQRDGFKRLIKSRLEIFPDTRDIQITILACCLEKNYNKMTDMLLTIECE